HPSKPGRSPHPGQLAGRLRGPGREMSRIFDGHQPGSLSMQVREAMTKGVECARPYDSIAEAAQKMKDLQVKALPVCGYDDRLKGMITDRDVAVRYRVHIPDPGRNKVRDVMSLDAVYCFEDQDVANASELMRKEHI